MRAERRTSQAGESLIEILVSVTIMGLAVVALVGGMGTAVFASALHRKQADVSVVMTSVVEHIKEQHYVTCAVKSSYLDSFSYPGYTRTVTAGGITLGTAGGPAYTVGFAIKDWYGGPAFVSRADLDTCKAFDQQGLRQHEITITVITADGQVTQAVPIIKRFRDCPPAIPLPDPGCDSA